MCCIIDSSLVLTVPQFIIGHLLSMSFVCFCLCLSYLLLSGVGINMRLSGSILSTLSPCPDSLLLVCELFRVMTFCLALPGVTFACQTPEVLACHISVAPCLFIVVPFLKLTFSPFAVWPPLPVTHPNNSRHPGTSSDLLARCPTAFIVFLAQYTSAVCTPSICCSCQCLYLPFVRSRYLLGLPTTILYILHQARLILIIRLFVMTHVCVPYSRAGSTCVLSIIPFVRFVSSLEKKNSFRAQKAFIVTSIPVFMSKSVPRVWSASICGLSNLFDFVHAICCTPPSENTNSGGSSSTSLPPNLTCIALVFFTSHDTVIPYFFATVKKDYTILSNFWRPFCVNVTSSAYAK